jgi:hypothetical protein
MIHASFSTVLGQLLLATLAMAAPLSTAGHHDNAWQYGTGGGILGLIVLILDIIVIGMPYITS